MHIADIHGRQFERRRQSMRTELRFAAIVAGILLGLGAAAIALVMRRAI